MDVGKLPFLHPGRNIFLVKLHVLGKAADVVDLLKCELAPLSAEEGGF